MRRVLTTLAVLVALGAVPATAGAAPFGHAGRWFTDAAGRAVVLHGLNMVSKRPPYAPSSLGFDGDDAAFLAANGFNTVRLGVIYAAVEPSPGHYDDAYIADIKATVDLLGSYGIASLLDFHQDLYNERFQGEGFPDWAVLDDGLPNQPQTGFPGNYLLMPATSHAFDSFWLDRAARDGRGVQEHYSRAWRHVAQAFAGDEAVLGYDLFNEPWPGSQWPSCANPAGCPVFDKLLAGAESKSIAAIRSVDHAHLIFPEPNVIFNDGADTNIGYLGDRGLALSFHEYCLPADTLYGGGPGADPPQSQYCSPFESLVFAHANAYSQRTGAGLMLSEFGATDDLAQLNRTTAEADQAMVSWQEWHYCNCNDPTTSGAGSSQALVIDPALPPSGANVKTDKLAALSRPYPQAVAGTPGSWSYDPASNRFTLTYSTRGVGGAAQPAGSETDVFVPVALHYGSGYAVTVRGATVTSAPGAQTLRLANCAGARGVSVTIAPGANAVAGGC